MSQRIGYVKMLVVAGLVAMCVSGTWANVVIDTVTVGDAGNVGEWSGAGAGGYGPDRICGAVDYGYNIGKYEVTAGQYTEFLNAVGGADTYDLYNASMSNTSYGSGITRSGGGTVSEPYTYSVASDFVNRPVNHVSFWDACRFGNWLHNGQPTGDQNTSTTEDGAYPLNGYTGYDGRAIQRNANWRWAVTNEDEWYKAAYYQGGSANPGYWDYPTSSDSTPGRDMDDVSGNNANYDAGSDPYPIDDGHYTTLVGEFQNSDSPYGTFDQGGNIWEWNGAIEYEETTYAYRGLRGGSFHHADLNLHASFRNLFIFPQNEDFYTGFRLSEVPEPATLGLLALGGALLNRRRGQGADVPRPRPYLPRAREGG
jgi:formylglycine-generating enzyme required for sulfatase activity